MVTALDYPLLLTAGFATGIINAVAGGGSIIIYPLLLSLGISPISANATSSMIILPGSTASAYGYRAYLKTVPRRYFLLLVPCLIGGIIGAFLLGHTSNGTFEYIVPWFILIATALLGAQNRIHKLLYSKQGLALERRHKLVVEIIIAAVLLIVSTYGGYFGAGFGIMFLAFLGLTELKDMHQMNGLKNLAGICINAIAVVYFVNAHLISWKVLPLLIIGNVAGGYLGAVYSTKFPGALIKRGVVVVGLILTVLLFLRQYG